MAGRRPALLLEGRVDPVRASFGRTLPQQTKPLQRPVDENGLPVNKASPHGAPVAAVVGGIAVVAQNIVRIRLDLDLGVAVLVAVSREDVRLVQRAAVDDHRASVDAHGVSGHADDAFYVRLAGVAGKLKDHSVAALDAGEEVDKFVDEDAL